MWLNAIQIFNESTPMDYIFDTVYVRTDDYSKAREKADAAQYTSGLESDREESVLRKR